jgi:hypothetical protein
MTRPPETNSRRSGAFFFQPRLEFSALFSSSASDGSLDGFGSPPRLDPLLQSGLPQAVGMLLIAELIAVLTTLSLCAICTNGEMKGGGSYCMHPPLAPTNPPPPVMISRSLGPEFGGSVGIIFWMGNILNCTQVSPPAPTSSPPPPVPPRHRRPNLQHPLAGPPRRPRRRAVALRLSNCYSNRNCPRRVVHCPRWRR